jgi:hypothetical protein
MKTRMHHRFSLLRSALLVTLAAGTSTLPAGAQTSLMLHSTMDDAEAIFRPVHARGLYNTIAEAIPGPAHVTFEVSPFGHAARIDARGFVYTWPVDGPIRFHGQNFDFDDPASDGGRLDFKIKFNVDPHATYANTWIARSNWGPRYVNFEFSGNPADLMIDVYGDVQHNQRTNFERFRVLPRNWSMYENIREGEWHQFSILWRRNGGPHKAELHIFINGTQAGCQTCSDYNGNLPPVGSITDFFFSPQLYDQYHLFSIDEVYSFDSWDVSGIEGNFADLQIPEGVQLKYPMDKRGPVWGSPVPEKNIKFEFTVVNDVKDLCDCDVYVDGEKVGRIWAVSGAHTEFFHTQVVEAGAHTYQVKCDGERLVSPIAQFDALSTITNVTKPSVGGVKSYFRQ